MVIRSGVHSIYSETKYATAANNPCPSSAAYITEFDSCYVFIDDAANFQAAERACNATQGHLVSMHNAFENGLLAEYADQDMRSSRAWIGLHRGDDGNWIWTDNTTASYFKWGSGEPKSKDCVYLDILDRSWYTQDCSTITPYICRLLPCKPGWVYYNVTEMCYYHGQNSSFQQALGFCGSYSGSVTSVHSDQENAFIKSLVWTPECKKVGNWYAGLTMLGGTWDQASMMNAFPPSCNGCGDGVWTMYGFDRINEKLPDFVCKAPPYVID
ncbi:unnamed protein product, partial [Mesorhabditis belari]|uniref:C-type lectin domain-containing protein n=1 Tax=Mesorhabditis belari TaxID=2138241 RepID=A0AAF3EAW1_9BILA